MSRVEPIAKGKATHAGNSTAEGEGVELAIGAAGIVGVDVRVGVADGVGIAARVGAVEGVMVGGADSLSVVYIKSSCRRYVCLGSNVQ